MAAGNSRHSGPSRIALVVQALLGDGIYALRLSPGANAAGKLSSAHSH
jgi:hypothetical protein